MNRWAVLWALSPLAAAGADIQIYYSVIQSSLANQAFTQDGRLYLKGKPQACTFAFLENPAVTGQNGKLHVTAKFTGRSAGSVLGFCVGGGFVRSVHCGHALLLGRLYQA